MKKASELIIDNKLVTLSNALTRAGCSLTLGEKRIVMLAVAKLNSQKSVPTHTFTTKITAAEYAESYDVEIHTAYEQLKTAAKNFYNRTLTFYQPVHRRNGTPLKPIRNDMRWVGRATYHEGEAWIELAWWYEVLPHLMGIKKQFTQYQLKQATALRSIHSWRLLELLMRFKSTGWAEYTIEDFGVSMQASEKQRSDFGKIRTQIIEPAVKELIEKDGWQIKWQPIKAGRRVKALRFEFSHAPRPQPNAKTRAAMQDAESDDLPAFASVTELFAELEDDGDSLT
jgi:plasmid replication initiation protein